MLKELLLFILLSGLFFFLIKVERNDKKTNGDSFLQKNKKLILIISIILVIGGYIFYFYGNELLENFGTLTPLSAIIGGLGIKRIEDDNIQPIPKFDNYSIEELETIRDALTHQDNLEKEMGVPVDSDIVLKTLDTADVNSEIMDDFDEREIDSEDDEQNMTDDIFEDNLSDYDFGSYSDIENFDNI